MRCIHCGTETRLRYRKDGRCYMCRHRFAFEPTKGKPRVTDAQFLAAIDRVSGDGRLQFTERALWYEFNRKWMRRGFWRSPYGRLPVVGMALGALAGVVIGAPYKTLDLAVGGGLAGVAAGTLAGMVMSLLANAMSPGPPRPPYIPYARFRSAYLHRWRKVHGEVPGLLSCRELAPPAAPREVPPDVAVFSFDRAVVTDRWETAQMLVANRFHFEHNCAVLSVDGYPDGIAGTVKEMLRRNPRLTVFALHDASPGGCLLPLTLREQEWFPDPAVRIVDLGLRPGMVRRLRIPALAGTSSKLPPRLGQVLPAEDVKWLARGHTAELAALRPAQVLRAAYQGIVAAGPGEGSWSGGSDGGGGGDTYYGGGVIWIGDLRVSRDTAAVDGFG